MLNSHVDYCKPHAKISSYDQFAAKSVRNKKLHPQIFSSCRLDKLSVCMHAADDARKQRKHKKVAIFRPARQDYTET